MFAAAVVRHLGNYYASGHESFGWSARKAEVDERQRLVVIRRVRRLAAAGLFAAAGVFGVELAWAWIPMSFSRVVPSLLMPL